MSLDIGVGDISSLALAEGEPSMCLEDGAFYWFLHPLFEQLAAKTGQYVDLYGYACFGGEQLGALRQMLKDARQLAEAQPKSWEVHVGTQVSPVHQELWRPLDRDAALELIAAWERIVARANELSRPVVCLGD